MLDFLYFIIIFTFYLVSLPADFGTGTLKLKQGLKVGFFFSSTPLPDNLIIWDKIWFSITSKSTYFFCLHFVTPILLWFYLWTTLNILFALKYFQCVPLTSCVTIIYLSMEGLKLLYGWPIFCINWIYLKDTAWGRKIVTNAIIHYVCFFPECLLGAVSFIGII